MLYFGAGRLKKLRLSGQKVNSRLGATQHQGTRETYPRVDEASSLQLKTFCYLNKNLKLTE